MGAQRVRGETEVTLSPQYRQRVTIPLPRLEGPVS